MEVLATLPASLHQRIVKKRAKFAALELSEKDLNDLEKQLQIEFVYNSNAIEGVTLSHGETALAMRGLTVSGKSISDVLAAQNHPKALEIVERVAFAHKKKIGEKDILDMHRAIMSGIVSTAGEYRRGEVQIAGATFTPPPAYMVPDLVSKDLVHFLNDNPGELRPIELAAHVHYYMAWIHPFDDGNGRMARLLMNLILLRNHYPFAIVKKIERKRYIDALDAVTGKGDFGPFLLFIARCVEQTLDIYLNRQGHSKFLPLSQLAKSSPYSSEYLSLQARKGVLDAVKIGRSWMSTRKTIAKYIEEHGRKGRK
ncbi:MAG TPA: Fic family protein [Nitrososphaera sp.]|nr:Fic family protein [Nitrososphaera sp.]